MLAIQTDLSLAKDVDEIGVYVLADGRPLLSESYPIENGSVRLPSTVAIASPVNPPSTVRVRVAAFKKGSARILREGITTVPSDRLAVLPLALRWIDDGSGSGTPTEFAFNPYASARSKCGEGLTQSLGTCVSSTIQESSLLDYDPAAIFGGGSEGAGSCFPTSTCFGAKTPVVVDEASCSFAKPALATFNVGAVTTGDGDAVGSDTLVALDRDAYWTVAGDRVNLAKAMCAAPVRARWTSIVVSGGCVTKTVRYPVCGSYSTGTPLPGN